jgi:GT2 family glycosyltransferase
MDLSIIIVNWNSANDVRKCVASIFAGTRDVRFEVIVVDSASFDGCGDMLAGEFPEVHFIQSRDNIGFGRANNLAANSAVGELLLFLNPDTEVLDDALTIMVGGFATLVQPGCVGCRLLNSDRTLQTSCIQSYPTITNQVLDSDWLRHRIPKARIWGMRPLFEESPAPSAVEAISGACIMSKRSVFESIGGFSADYFMYAEDMDLCLKAHNAGYINYYLPRAVVLHHGDSSSRKARSDFAVVMAADSLTRYFLKFHGPLYAWTYKTLITGIAFVRLLLMLPFRLAAGHSTTKSSIGLSWKKWKAVLRWGFGMENWTDIYQRNAP